MRGRPRFDADERLRIRTAKTALAIVLSAYIDGRTRAFAVVQAVGRLMVALKILRAWPL